MNLVLKFSPMESKNLCPPTAATVFACQSIADSFAENIFELAHLRKEWNYDYAVSLKKKACQMADKISSTGNIHQIIDKLQVWREIMISCLTDLSIIRASVKTDFKSDKSFQKDLFRKLGYNDFFSDAKNGDHYGMYRFIMVFAANLTPELRKEILSGGLDPHVVDRVIAKAGELENFKECFTILKDGSGLSAEVWNELNGIFTEIRDISRIATAYYYFDPLKRESFNFFKVLRNIRI